MRRNQSSMLYALCVIMFAIAIQGEVAAQSNQTLSWVADAPGEFVRLIDRGNVRIVVDDERLRQAGKSALTVFRFVVDYDFKFRHQLLGYDTETNSWQAKIVAWIDQPKVTLEHKICIQSTFHSALPWESQLLRHEFDHVAISTDPRVFKFIKRALQQRREWTGRWEQAIAPTEQDIRVRVLESITAEVHALERFVQTQYDILDIESSQGTSAIQSRTAFFKGLYTMDGIEKCNYELTPIMADFVRQKMSNPSNLKDIETHYLFLTP